MLFGASEAILDTPVPSLPFSPPFRCSFSADILKPFAVISEILYFGQIFKYIFFFLPPKSLLHDCLTPSYYQGADNKTEAQKIGSLRKGTAGIRYKISPLLVSPHVELHTERTLRLHIWRPHYIRWS
jgi:hypothetical protein